MANWKKVVVSGSDARLSSIGVGSGISAPSTDGQISASGKLFATTAIPATPIAGEFNVVIKNSNGEFAITGSDAITPVLQTLTKGDGVTMINTSTAATVAGFDGSVGVSIGIDTGSLAGQGLNDNSGAINVGGGTNITVLTDAIVVDTASLCDTTQGLQGSNSNAGKIEINLASSTGLAFNGSGELSASFVPGATLSAGNGITMTNYNGVTAQSAAVDVAGLSGEGIESDGAGSPNFRIKNANNLTTDRLIKWNGTQFVDSLVSDSGTEVTLGVGATPTVVAGNLRVNGTASFTHADNLEITDPFITLNSSSTAAGSDTFGIVGATSATHGIGWSYDGSNRWTMTSGSALVSGGTYGTLVGAASLLVNSTSTSETDAFMAQEGNFMVSSDEIYVYF